MKIIVFLIVFAQSVSFASESKIIKSMGLNLSAPQSEQKLVSASVPFADVFKTARPLVESVYKRVREKIRLKGPESMGVELVKSEKTPLDLPLSGFLADKYIYYYVQKNKTDFPDLGIKIHEDKTVSLQKNSTVHTSLLESARLGDVPNGIYSLYFKGDVSLKVEGIGKVVKCSSGELVTASSVSASASSGITLPDGITAPEGIDVVNNCIKTDVPEEQVGWLIRLWRAILKFIMSIFGIDTTQQQETLQRCDEVSNLSADSTVDGFVTRQDASEGEGNDSDAQFFVAAGIPVCIDVTIPETPNRDGLKITFKALKETHLKDIKMIMPGVDKTPVLKGKVVFNPAYLNYIKPFKTLRVMNLINASPRSPKECVYLYDKETYQSWNNVDRKTPYGECLMKHSRTLENRAKLEDQTWGNSYLEPLENWRGVPYEVLVELAKVTGADLWVNVPHNSSDEYIKSMAKYFAENLPEAQKVTLEYSNEIWNGGFWGQKYMIGLANDQKEYYEEQAVGQVEKYVNKRTRFKTSYMDAFEKYKHLKRHDLEKEMPDLDTYWNGYIGARKDIQQGVISLEDRTNANRLTYNPDFISQLNKEEIESYEAALLEKYKEGYALGETHGMRVYDFKKEAEIHVKKRLLRAYQYIASLAYVDGVAKIHDLWIEAGFSKDRLITVVGTKQSNPGVTEIMLEYAESKKYIDKIDAIAMGAYFYGCLGQIDDIKSGEIGECEKFEKGIMSVKSSSGLLDVLESDENPKGVENVKQELTDHLEAIKKIDERIQIMAYEGGHHLSTSLAKRRQIIYLKETKGREKELLEIFKEAIEDPRMGVLTEKLYDAWLEVGGSTFINFDMAHGYHKWGSFGLSESVADLETSRYKAAKNYVEVFDKAN